jgi:hypothetical protein
MLTRRHLATIHAALQFWEEEMCPHSDDIVRPYLEPSDAVPLSLRELRDLRETLRLGLRYAIYDPNLDRLGGTDLFATVSDAAAAAGTMTLVSVFVEPSPPPTS